MLDVGSVSLLLKQLFGRYLGLAEQTCFQSEQQLYGWCIKQDNYLAIKYWRQQLLALNDFSAVCDRQQPTAEYQCVSADFTEQGLDFDEVDVSIGVLAQGIWAYVLSAFCQHHQVIFAQSCSMKRLLAQPASSNSSYCLGRFSHVLPVVVAVDEQLPVDDWLDELQRAEDTRAAHSHLTTAELMKCTETNVKLLFNSQVVVEEDWLGQLKSIIDGGNSMTSKEKQIDIREFTVCRPFCAPIIFAFSVQPVVAGKIYYDQDLISEQQAQSFLQQCQQTLLAFIDKQYPKLEAFVE